MNQNSEEVREIIKKIGMEAIKECNRMAKEYDIENMSLEEINAEIAAARAESAEKKK